MTEETREQKVKRLIEKHIRDRNMDPKSITEHYGKMHYAFEIDPDFFDAMLSTAWGFFKDEPRHLDHMTRQIIISVFLAYRDRPGCYHQGKKGVMMGVTYEQMLEGYEVGMSVGGGPVLVNGMEAIKRMIDEGIKPGCQVGPWTNKWVQLGPRTPIAEKEKEKDPQAASESREERIIRMIKKYNADEAGDINKDLEYGVRLDPDFFESYLPIAWTFLDDKPRHLDPIRREMIMLGILAYKGRREEVYSHTKKALRLGATVEQLLEAFETAACTGQAYRFYTKVFMP